MDIRLGQARLSGRVETISAKSHLHRLLIAAALADDETQIIAKGAGDDAQATIRVLEGLGARIEKNESGFRVCPIGDGECCKSLDAGESGSTLRFLLPVAAALGREVEFRGRGRLAARPISELAEALRGGGARITGDNLSIKVSGKLRGGDYRVVGDVSSQYISGLMFALPLLDGDSQIIIEGKTVSVGYIDITLGALARFGINIEKRDYGYFVRGGQRFQSPRKIVAEGDWSNAAFWLTAGAIGGRVTVAGLDINSPQGDKRIVDLLSEMGAVITVNGGDITADCAKLRGICLNAEDVPDLVPILSVAAACARGVTEIGGVERLRQKESDRITAVLNMLTAFGIECGYEGGMLKIKGGQLSGGRIDGFGDHRIIMSAAVGALYAHALTQITDSECVSKSYPAFFDDYKALGGIIYE